MQMLDAMLDTIKAGTMAGLEQVDYIKLVGAVWERIDKWRSLDGAGLKGPPLPEYLGFTTQELDLWLNTEPDRVLLLKAILSRRRRERGYEAEVQQARRERDALGDVSRIADAMIGLVAWADTAASVLEEEGGDPRPAVVAGLREKIREASGSIGMLTPTGSMDPDGAGAELLTSEIDRLKAAVRRHYDQRGDDRCHLDDLKLYHDALGIEPDPYVTALPPEADMAESCRRYVKQRQCPAVAGKYPVPGGMTIAQLTEAVERWQEALTWAVGYMRCNVLPLTPALNDYPDWHNAVDLIERGPLQHGPFQAALARTELAEAERDAAYACAFKIGTNLFGLTEEMAHKRLRESYEAWKRNPEEAAAIYRAGSLDRQAGRMPEAKAEWLDRLGRLAVDIKGWAEAAGWRTRIVNKPVTEREFGGRYLVPLLLMERDGIELALSPVARFVAGSGSEGQVDLYRMPACDDIANLACVGGKWRVRHASFGGGDGTRDLTAEALWCVLDTISEPDSE